MPGESFDNPCACVPAPGTTVPTTPYVVSIAGLNGIVEVDGQGALQVSTLGNTIVFSLSASAGLGTVTQVAASSSNSNLVIGGTPINTTGTLAFALSGNLNSISGLVMAADQMLYSTGVATFSTTPLTAFGRSLIDDAASVNARTTLGLVIGTDVQAWNAKLDSLIVVASFGGGAMSLSGGLTVGANLTVNVDASVGGNLSVTGTVSSGAITATSFTGNGSGLTTLNASNISSGTLAVARGGTNISSYAVGDLIYASAGTTLAKLADVAAGSYLRSGGVTTAPLWSTLTLPNAATTGDILHATGTNAVGRLAAVAVNNVLLSGGVGVISSWGKVTTSHTTGIAASGANGDITSLSAISDISSDIDMAGRLALLGALQDGSTSPGTSGELLSSTGTGVDWTNQIIVDTITINTRISIEGTLTAGGVTGAQTINKPSGTVRFAAGASSLVVTNNLCTTSDRVLATVCTNDATAYVKNVVTTSGAFTIILGAAATGETEVYWDLKRVS